MPTSIPASTIPGLTREHGEKVLAMIGGSEIRRRYIEGLPVELQGPVREYVAKLWERRRQRKGD